MPAPWALPSLLKPSSTLIQVLDWAQTNCTLRRLRTEREVLAANLRMHRRIQVGMGREYGRCSLPVCQGSTHQSGLRPALQAE